MQEVRILRGNPDAKERKNVAIRENVDSLLARDETMREEVI